jgi:hypothetical protein
MKRFLLGALALCLLALGSVAQARIALNGHNLNGVRLNGASQVGNTGTSCIAVNGIVLKRAL